VAAAPQTPELHAARGRALGELYRRALEDALEEARRSGDQARVVRRQQELAGQLFQARRELEQSRKPGQDTLLDAQLALYRGELAAAEDQARRLAGSAPELAEAHALAADAAYRAAVEAFGHGDYDTARTALDRSTAAYAEAGKIARSDPSIYCSAAEAWLQRAELDFRQRGSSSEALDRALDLIDQWALRADPGHVPAYATRSNILVRRYRTGHAAPGEERALLDRAVAAAARGVELDRGDALAWISLSTAHTMRGAFAMYHGEPPAPWWWIAGAELDAALAIQPGNLRAADGRGAVHRWLGSDLEKTGQDPMLEYDAARDAFQRAIEIDPQSIDTCSYRTEIEVLIAEHLAPVNRDPRDAVEAAERIGARCRKIDPNFYQVLDSLARGQLALAQYFVQGEREPADAVRCARDYLDADEKLHPGHTSLWFHRAVAARIEATSLLQHDTDPRSSIADGRNALARAQGLMPESAYALLETVRLDLIDAAWAAKPGWLPAAWLGTAAEHADKLTGLDGQLLEARLIQAYLQVAAPPPSYDVACTGLSSADRMAKLDPRLPELQALDAALRRRCER
jgi:eukaryotic-like serine/threonine-protein kinase